MLTSERLLVHDPNRGYFVASMHPAEVRQLYRARELLEPEVMRSLSWPSDDELRDLRETAQAAIRELCAGNFEEGLMEEQRFYFAIYDLSSLTFLASEVKRLWSMADPFRRPAFISVRASDPTYAQLAGQHERILRALETRDAETLVDEVTIGRMGVINYASQHEHNALANHAD